MAIYWCTSAVGDAIIVELHWTLPEFSIPEHFEIFNNGSQGSIQYYKILFHGSFGRDSEWTVSGCEGGLQTSPPSISPLLDSSMYGTAVYCARIRDQFKVN